nr:hypothetical protein [Mucilaginibacter sp. L294]
MELTDIAGKVFTIHDVEGTIAVVTEFLAYQPSHAFGSLLEWDEQRLRYWLDFLEKLEQLKNQ